MFSGSFEDSQCQGLGFRVKGFRLLVLLAAGVLSMLKDASTPLNFQGNTQRLTVILHVPLEPGVTRIESIHFGVPYWLICYSIMYLVVHPT